MKPTQLFLFVFVFLTTCIDAYASPAYPFPINFTQPNGKSIQIIMKGDESVKWANTIDGYTLLYNKEGYLEYAQLDDKGSLISSGISANNQSNRTKSETLFLSGIKKGLTFSAEQLKTIRLISEIKNDNTKRSFPTTGNRKLICILIGFPDKPFTKSKEDFEALFNQVNYSTGGATGSVKDYYLENSYEKLNLSITVAGPYISSSNMSAYGANNSSGSDTGPRELVSEAILAADKDVDYTQFDNDNDGNVDGVYVIYAGYGEEAGGGSDAIWAHAWSLSPSVILDGKTLSKYSCSAELRGNNGSNITTIGVICHEFGHVLGAPDYYDTDYEKTGGNYAGTGKWDLMAGGSWNNNGITPASHNAYTKTLIYDWAQLNTISAPGQFQLSPSVTSTNSFYAINTTTANEFFLLENRQNIGFDSKLPGHGLIIYHIHSNVMTVGNKINIQHPQLMYPVCASALVEPNADPTSYGSINSGGCPFPGIENKTEFTDETTPSSKSWAGANTLLPITKIYESNVGIISFEILEANFYTSNNRAEINEMITFVDASYGGATSWEWNFGEGATPSSASTKGPHTVKYSTIGEKTISLTVNGNKTVTKPAYISVYDPTTTATPLVSWNFESKSNLPSLGISENLNQPFSATATGGVSYSEGSENASSYSITSNGWNSGMDKKAWVISLTTLNYKNLVLSSKQSGSNLGPKNFKVQYRTPSTNWIDVPNATTTLNSSFESNGILNSIPLPVSCNNLQSLYLRWVMVNDISISGSQVTQDGTSKIDEVSIVGLKDVTSTDIQEMPNNTVIFPTPFKSSLTISSTKQLKRIYFIDIVGKIQLIEDGNNETSQTINTESLANGYYIVKAIDVNGKATTTKTVKQ